MPPNKETLGPDSYYKDDDLSIEHEKFTEVNPNHKFSLNDMLHDLIHLDWSKVKWDMVAYLAGLHILGLVGLYKLLTLQIMLPTFAWAVVLGVLGGLGISIASHRMWCHRSLKAILPTKIVLIVMATLGNEESVYSFSLKHRSHHKWSETDRDFTDARRGFFFAHMGWKLLEFSPLCLDPFDKVDMRDLLADRVVMMQYDYYYYLYLFINILIPTLVPEYLWGEDLFSAFVTCYALRYVISLNGLWCVGSFAHFYGNRPYDSSMGPAQNLMLTVFALGEGWHNYHHTFPNDYRGSEINTMSRNLSTCVIEALHKFGLVYDLKFASEEQILKRIGRTGDMKQRNEHIQTYGNGKE